MRKKIISLCLFFSVAPAIAQDRTVILTSLDWPPYTGAELKEYGASAAVATAAFKAMGYTLKFEFFPWARTVHLAKTDARYAGYFPEYYSKDIEKEFIFSDPAGTGPLGFVELKGTPVKWSTLDDLKEYTIGVVEGYVNTDQFDAMVAAKILKVEPVTDDATNLRKVANKRLPLAVIDPNVMKYLLNNDKALVQYRDVLQFNAKPLEMKKLYACFKKGPTGEKYTKIFNEGLKKISVDKIMQDYFANVLAK